jgi:hypothetical protein
MVEALPETEAELVILFAGMAVTYIITHFGLLKTKRTKRTRGAWGWVETRETGLEKDKKHYPRPPQLYVYSLVRQLYWRCGAHSPHPTVYQVSSSTPK